MRRRRNTKLWVGREGARMRGNRPEFTKLKMATLTAILFFSKLMSCKLIRVPLMCALANSAVVVMWGIMM